MQNFAGIRHSHVITRFPPDPISVRWFGRPGKLYLVCIKLCLGGLLSKTDMRVHREPGILYAWSFLPDTWQSRLGIEKQHLVRCGDQWIWKASESCIYWKWNKPYVVGVENWKTPFWLFISVQVIATNTCQVASENAKLLWHIYVNHNYQCVYGQSLIIPLWEK